jgi:hypothetical protein
LWGWEPRQITEHVYDESGRLVETITRREPEFDKGQVAVLLAHLRQEREPRGSHGIPLSKATGPEADPALTGRRTFVVEGPQTDFAAQALSEAQKRYYDANPKAPRQSHLWSVRPADPPSAAPE